MPSVSRGLLWVLCLSGGLAATPIWADTLFAVRVLRESGCGGTLPSGQPLHHNTVLDRVAAGWASGRPLPSVAGKSGYQPVSTAGLHVRGPDEAMLGLLRRSGCAMLVSAGFDEVGYYRRGMDTWVVLARGSLAEVEVKPASAAVTEQPAVPIPAPPESAPPSASSRPDSPVVGGAAPTATARLPHAPRSLARVWSPSQAPTPILATRALQLVNDVRAHGTRCGEQLFGPVPPVSLSGTLASVAFGHASDMAEHHYFEHRDLTGLSPADRVRAVGYQEKLVGENIAYGPKSIEEVVQGWLDSPGHCENIMDPRFAEMGIGYATGRAGTQQGLYWVQVLAQPRA